MPSTRRQPRTRPVLPGAPVPASRGPRPQISQENQTPPNGMSSASFRGHPIANPRGGITPLPSAQTQFRFIGTAILAFRIGKATLHYCRDAHCARDRLMMSGRSASQAMPHGPIGLQAKGRFNRLILLDVFDSQSCAGYFFLGGMMAV